MAKTKNAQFVKDMQALNTKYQQRITLVRLGKAAYAKNDFANAIKNYQNYLNIISEVKNVAEPQLRPEHFDKKKESSEMMLISQIHWDLAKVFDFSPKMHNEFKKSISKFVAFSKGMPYQVVNAEILRKYIERGRIKNKADFKNAYKQIYVVSKRCFIAEFSFGEDPRVEILRNFRDEILLDSTLGQKFVINYYTFSPKLINRLSKNSFVKQSIITLVFRPLLWPCILIAKISLKLNHSVKGNGLKLR